MELSFLHIILSLLLIPQLATSTAHHCRRKIINQENIRRTNGYGCKNPRGGVSSYRRNGISKKMSVFLKIRGGSNNVLSDFSSYIGRSKWRCWVVLVLAILTDTASTTLMKIAKDESSFPKLVASYFGYFMR